MLDSLSTESWEDFRQRYLHTYCWYRRKGGGQTFVYITDVRPEQVAFTVGDGIRYYVEADSGAVFEFIPVDRGWFNQIGSGPKYLYRVPERQWRRGISDGNTAVRDHAMNRLDIDYKMLKGIFEPARDNWNVPFSLTTPVALSRNFMSNGAGALFFNDQHVGTITKDGVKVDHLLLQEVRDIVRRRNINLPVEAM